MWCIRLVTSSACRPLLQWYEKYMALQIEVPGKDLCDMSGAKGRTPDQFTVGAMLWL